MCPHCENRQRTGFLIGQGWICCPRWMRRCPLRWRSPSRRSADEVQSAAHAQATSTVRVSWVVEGDVWCATVLDTVAAYHPTMGCALLKVARARQPILRWTVLAGASETAPGLILMYLSLLIVCSDRGRVFIVTPTVTPSVSQRVKPPGSKHICCTAAAFAAAVPVESHACAAQAPVDQLRR